MTFARFSLLLTLTLFIGLTAHATTINIRDSPYNAVCNGTTDDTAAIASALAAAQSTRSSLFIPSGDCLVSGSGAQLFLITQPSIEIYGEGKECSRIIVGSVGSGTNIFHIVPPVTGGQPTGAWAMTANGRDNRGLNMHDFSIEAQTEPSLFTDPYPSQPGLNALYFDTSTPGQFLHSITIERMYFGALGGRAMYFNNVYGGDYANLDGVYQILIANNIIRNGILADYWGDSIRIENNAFVGMNAAIESIQVPGATTLNIVGNNITNRGGLVFRNGLRINLENNIIELFVVPSSGSNGAAIDCRGDLSPSIWGINIHNNIINTHVTPLDGIRLDNVTMADIDHNSFNGLAGKYAIKTTTATVNTVYGINYIPSYSLFALTNNVETAPIRRLVTTTAIVGSANAAQLQINNFGSSGLAGVYLNGGLAQANGGFVQYNNTSGNKNLFIGTGGNDPVYLGTNNTVQAAVTTGGDISVSGSGNGVLLRSPNGTICKRLGIDNSGAITLGACP